MSAASALAGQVFEQLSSLMKDGYAVATADVKPAAQLLDRDGGRGCATTS